MSGGAHGDSKGDEEGVARSELSGASGSSLTGDSVRVCEVGDCVWARSGGAEDRVRSGGAEDRSRAGGADVWARGGAELEEPPALEYTRSEGRRMAAIESATLASRWSLRETTRATRRSLSLAKSTINGFDKSWPWASYTRWTEGRA